MKILKYIFYFLLPCLSYGQTNCDHDVSTDYLNPQNNALPTGSSSNLYLNGFNWFPVGAPGTTEEGLYMDYPCTNISFGGVNYPEMNNILSSALSDYDYLTDGPLPLNENGWELLLVNLGRYPDDLTSISTGNDLYALPYIVIYNRYSGTIRVFVNFGLDHTVGDGADAIEIELTFNSDNQISGLLRLNEGADQALDEKSDVIKLKSICKAPALGRHWASTDFKITYDPCTCYYPSKLKLNFGQISSSSIELHGRSITLENEPLINNSNLQTNPAEYLSGFDYTGNTAEGGVAMHKSIQYMIDDYLKKYEQYNKDLVATNEHNANVKRNLAILQMGKFVVGLIANPPTGVVLTAELIAERAQELAAIEHTGKTEEEIYEAYYGLGVQEQGGWFNVVKNLQKGIIASNEAGNKMVNNEALFGAITQIFGEKGKTFIQTNFKEKILHLNLLYQLQHFQKCTTPDN